MGIVKICHCCGETLPIEKFVKDKRSKDGYATICKCCKNKQIITKRLSDENSFKNI